MSTPAPGERCYLVEWYLPEVTQETVKGTAAMLEEAAASMSAVGAPVKLLFTLAMPSDEVLFGVFFSGSAELVGQVCQLARVPARRLSDAVGASIAGVRRTGIPDSANVHAP